MSGLINLAAVCAVFVACSDNGEKLARQRLQAAQEYFDKGDYNSAKTEIDSIKILYPKAFDVRHEGIRLMQQVELKEQERSLAYLDSMMALRQADFEAIEARYVLEKDTAYQQIGHYLAPSQVLEKNLHRSYLRFQVTEKAQLSMTSIYCGASNIHHSSVKVVAPDGTFAETPMSTDSYETTDLSEKIEKADYQQTADGGVMAFIYANRDKNLRVTLQGDRDYTFAMPAADRDALVSVYELWQTLSSIEQIRKEQEEANLKITFIHQRMSRQADEESK
jgi:hypothetical protein